MNAALLEVAGLRLELTTPFGTRTLVEDVSFSLAEGEILGLVGESGSGKSLTCRALMQLLPPNIRIADGRVDLVGENVVALDETGLRQVRGRKIGMIFQNPSAFLDPVMTIGDQVGESLRIEQGLSRKEARAEAEKLLRQVGIPDPASRVHAYPHEFSGGMRQRAMIAAALAYRPRILIADEPTTALDVTIQAQILRLLLDLKDEFGLSIILVTHDLSVVSQTCDRIVVMYAGHVMEAAPMVDLLAAPRHPYSRGLIASQPEAAPPGQELPSIPGQPPSSGCIAEGCSFEPRCTMARAQCRSEKPDLAAISAGRTSACHFWPELAE